MASLPVQKAIDELVASISIIESANVMESTRGGVSAKLVCGCTSSERNPSRQTSKKNCPTLLACVQSLRELIEKKHAHCIAAKLAEDEAADAAAARKQNLGLLSVITDGARKAERAERHAAELLPVTLRPFALLARSASRPRRGPRPGRTSAPAAACERRARRAHNPSTLHLHRRPPRTAAACMTRAQVCRARTARPGAYARPLYSASAPCARVRGGICAWRGNGGWSATAICILSLGLALRRP